MQRKLQKGSIFLAVVALMILISACRPDPTPAPVENPTSFSGTVKTGAELGEVKKHCLEGLYLVAEEGFLTGQTSMLLLRVLDDTGQALMLSEPIYVDRQVEVVGKYPAQEVFCEALICQCEDYILVEQIELR